MIKQHIYWYWVAILFLFHACQPLDFNKDTSIKKDIHSPTVQQVYEWQDQQELDSLITLLSNEDVTKRYWATLAFASIKKEAAVDTLIALLNDPVEDIRTVAAYALGQIGAAKTETALVKAFNPSDTIGQFNRAVLEAIGKIGSRENLELISTVESYQPTDIHIRLDVLSADSHYL